MSEHDDTPAIIISEQMSLLDLASALSSETLQLTEAEHTILGQLIRSKVDACCQFRDAVADEIARHKEYAKKHKEHSDSLAKKLERFEEYVSYTMKAGGFDKLPGSEFQIGLRKSVSTEIDGDPSEADHVNMPEFVQAKTSYSWKKAEIKKALESGSFPFSNARLVTNHNPQFQIKKGK